MSSLQSLRKSRLANYLRGYWHILRPPVHSPQDMALLQRTSQYQIVKPRKLLHIGANCGAEAKYYSQNGIEAWHVEAIPEVYDRLCENLSSYESQHPIHACLSSIPGESVSFNISSNSGLSSSLLGLGRHSRAYPSVHYSSSVALTSSTVDQLIDVGAIPRDIDFLVVDVQGAEFLVLQGSQGLLASGSLQGAMIETSVEPLYEEGSTYIDVSSLLRSHDLYLCQAVFNQAGWCDALYSKRYWP